MPGFQLQLASDYKYLANREKVTLFDLNMNPYVVTDAKRLLQDVAERQPSHGEYLATVVDWRVPAVQVAGSIQPGWTVVDTDAVSYVVLEVDPPGTYGGQWHLYCQSLMVLGHMLTVVLPVDQTDSYGSPITNQNNTLPAQPAAIQEQSKELVKFQDVVHGFRYHYSIWIMQELRLAEGSIATDERGYVYQIESQRNRRRLEELVELEAIINP